MLRDPDGLTLDVIIKYLEIAELLPENEIALTKLIQVRRNAVHAFRDREIGTVAEFASVLREFRAMLLGLHHRLPYPDEFHGFGII